MARHDDWLRSVVALLKAHRLTLSRQLCRARLHNGMFSGAHTHLSFLLIGCVGGGSLCCQPCPCCP